MIYHGTAIRDARRAEMRARLRGFLWYVAAVALFVVASVGEWWLLTVTTPAHASAKPRTMYPLCDIRALAVGDSFFALVPGYGYYDTLYVAHVGADSTLKLCYPEPLWPMAIRMKMHGRGPLDSMQFLRGDRYLRNPRFSPGCDWMTPWRAFPVEGGKP